MAKAADLCSDYRNHWCIPVGRGIKCVEYCPYYLKLAAPIVFCRTHDHCPVCCTILVPRQRADLLDHAGETGSNWDDYRGNPEIVENAKRIVTLLKGVKDFKKMGGQAIRGLLLCGPPGTGKSYLAQVIANEAQIPFAYASAPSFQNMFFGVGNLKVMSLYRKARRLAKTYGACIIFIDEIDAIGMSRQSGGGAGGISAMFGMGGSGLLNELLLQMDPPNIDHSRFAKLLRSLGLRHKKAEHRAVLTIGATNLPDVLDPALLRPGRFDRKLWVYPPDYDGRVDVFDYYLKKVKRDQTLTPQKAALDTIGYSPAQIKHIVNEAIIIVLISAVLRMPITKISGLLWKPMNGAFSSLFAP